MGFCGFPMTNELLSFVELYNLFIENNWNFQHHLWTIPENKFNCKNNLHGKFLNHKYLIRQIQLIFEFLMKEPEVVLINNMKCIFKFYFWMLCTSPEYCIGYQRLVRKTCEIFRFDFKSCLKKRLGFRASWQLEIKKMWGTFHDKN